MESIARLIAELSEVRVISDRRADQLVSQAETIGTLRASLATAQATISALEARTVPESPPAPTESTATPGAFLTRWWPLLVMLAVAVLLAAVLLLVPR